MKATRRKAIRFSDMPTEYPGLVALLAPRPVRDRIDAGNVEEIVMAMAGHELSSDQSDYLNVLSVLLEEYTQRTRRQPRRSSVKDRLSTLLESSEMTQAQFAKIAGVSQPMASMILSGKRGLSKTNILRLAKHFRLNAEYFM